MKKQNVIKFIAALLVLAIAIYTAAMGFGSKQTGSINDIKLGLDLAGGVSITYETADPNPSKEAMSDTIFKLQQRITDSGYTEGEVYPEGENRINVDIPNVNDPEKILQELGKPGSLAFVDEAGNIILTGEDIKNAQPQKMTQGITGAYEISLEMTSEGAKKFEEATGANIGKVIHIIYNNEVLLSPNVQQKISGGQAVITNMENHEVASRVASFIRIGALPLELKELRSNVVGAKMGQDVVTTSLKAGVIGICLVFAFMIIFYGIPGIAASIALVFYSSLVIVALSLFNITLTLGGIAGMILSVGMAVDANVIIFARIREELAEGKTIRAAVKAGFSKALSSIVDGNVTTLIAAGVLYTMGTGTIRGFAITLGLGILVSMFTALVVTRVLLDGFIAFGWNPKAKTEKKESKIFKIIESRVRFFALSAALIVLGFVFLPVNSSMKASALNYDIEFAGGTSTIVSADKHYASVDELQADVLPLVQEATGEATAQLNTANGADGQSQFIIKTKTLNTEQRDKLNQALIEKYGITSDNIQSSTIGATIGSEMRKNAIVSVLIASLLMLVYIWFRFKEVSFGIAAIIALLHDVFVVFMVYSVFFVPINNSFIAAMLTIVGYSINDTIVVFDRIRENQRRVEHGNYKLLSNISISQTIGRSINTSITTLIMVLVLQILGTVSIQALTLPLLVGILSGTYSSIFIASPLWYLFKKKHEKAASK
ncbi:protein translocase subunit SecD [Clostridiales bacterium COT073_COT-073]|nr:protein translocase subunit SecD [Clostridiales bacterium COT073_COT-073]